MDNAENAGFRASSREQRGQAGESSSPAAVLPGSSPFGATLAEQFEALAREQARIPPAWSPFGLAPFAQQRGFLASGFLASGFLGAGFAPGMGTWGYLYTPGVPSPAIEGFYASMKPPQVPVSAGSPADCHPTATTSAGPEPPSSIAQEFEAIARLHKARADELLLKRAPSRAWPQDPAAPSSSPAICEDNFSRGDGWSPLKRRKVGGESAHSLLAGSWASNPPSLDSRIRQPGGLTTAEGDTGGTSPLRSARNDAEGSQVAASSEESDCSSPGTWVEEAEGSSQTEERSRSQAHSSGNTGESASHSDVGLVSKRRQGCLETGGLRRRPCTSAPEPLKVLDAMPDRSALTM